MAASVGFVYQATYRLEAGRPVVWLFGRLQDGRTFLLRDTRRQPRFWVRAQDADAARAAGAAEVGEAGGPGARRTLDGAPAVEVRVAVPADQLALRDRLRAAGVPTYEADVGFPTRYLIDAGIRAALAIDGVERAGADIAGGLRVDVVFDDPEIRPAEWSPRPTVLSLDIETDPRASRVLSAALHGCGASEVLCAAASGGAASGAQAGCPEGAVLFAGERELLAALAARIVDLDPDVLTGWNVVDFDLAVLARRAEALRVPFEIGRAPGRVQIRRARGFRAGIASVPGRLVLDGLDLLRGSFIRMERSSLDFVAREVLGEGKTLTGPSRVDEILRLWQEDLDAFVTYNLTDARLVTEILEKLDLVTLAVERSRLTGLTPDRVAASIAAFDFLYLSELSRRGIVAPSVGDGAVEEQPTEGGHVLEPVTGLHRNVFVFDFRSLYPSVIRTFQVDPLGLRLADGTDDAILAPNGARFAREPGILPRILDDLFPRREAARRAGDAVTSQAIKILMNSFYGVLGTPACRFYDPRLANAITGFGRELLLWTKARCEQLGHRVLYGDTDSLFVEAGVADADAAFAAGGTLVARLNADLAEHVRATWRVESRLALQFEKMYARLLLPHMRRGEGGARKRYAGLRHRPGAQGGAPTGAPAGTVEFTGMEVVRRDWTALAKEVQRELYLRLFTDRPVEEYLRELVAGVRAGAFDDRLVYRKALRKDLGAYTHATPPHVAAARKRRGAADGDAGSEGRSGSRLVSYVITIAGAEPEDERRNPIDREHYVQKQVRPVAEPVLEVLGLEFDRVVRDDRQGRLF